MKKFSPLSKIKGLVKAYLVVCGIFLHLFLLWMITGWPLFFDRVLIRSESPVDAEYIVCVCAGLTGGNLPTDDGMQRIYTAVQLYLDGYGAKIIFTGGGSGRVSEAEVYAETAGWLGFLRDDAVFDPGPNQTSEHPKNILKIGGLNITRGTRLNIVTSALHSRRTALCFEKDGYSNFRMVTAYSATGRTAEKPLPPEKAREEKRAELWKNPDRYIRERQASRLEEFHPSAKVYNDVLIRLKWHTAYFFTALREIGAIAWYKVKGYI